MTELGVLAEHLRSTAKAVEETPAHAVRAVGAAGKNVLVDEAGRRWGTDRRWSGAVRSRNRSTSQEASARYDVADNGKRVEWQPTGTPWTVTIRGRRADSRRITPRSPTRAFNTPFGPRASQQRVTAMAAKGNIVAPVVPRIERDAVTALHDEWVRSLGRIYRAG